MVLNTLWQREQLPVLLSEVVSFVLLGVLRRFQPRVCQITRTVHILVILPSYSIVLNTLWQREQLPVLLSEVVLFVLLGVLRRVLRRFQPHVIWKCQITRKCSHTGDSTQLLNGTEHTVTKGAIARPAFRGRFVCIVGCSTPFSTSCMSNHTHCSHTGDSTQLLNSTEHTVTKGAIARPAFRGRFVCIVGCFMPISTSFKSYHPVSSHTRDPWVNQPSYAIDLNTLWQGKQLPAML